MAALYEGICRAPSHTCCHTELAVNDSGIIYSDGVSRRLYHILGPVPDDIILGRCSGAAAGRFHTAEKQVLA